MNILTSGLTMILDAFLIFLEGRYRNIKALTTESVISYSDIDIC